MTWLAANWKAVLLVVLAVDSALIPLFPQVGIFGAIKNLLSGLTASGAPKA